MKAVAQAADVENQQDEEQEEVGDRSLAREPHSHKKARPPVVGGRRKLGQFLNQFGQAGFVAVSGFLMDHAFIGGFVDL